MLQPAKTEGVEGWAMGRPVSSSSAKEIKLGRKAEGEGEDMIFWCPFFVDLGWVMVSEEDLWRPFFVYVGGGRREWKLE